MQAFLVSLSAVALAEIGDKTQLLSLTLAAKYRRPWPICIGILAATLVNHSLAGAAAHASIGGIDVPLTVAFTIPAMIASLLGARLAAKLPGKGLQIGVAVLVLVIAVVTLVATIIPLT